MGSTEEERVKEACSEADRVMSEVTAQVFRIMEKEQRLHDAERKQRNNRSLGVICMFLGAFLVVLAILTLWMVWGWCADDTATSALIWVMLAVGIIFLFGGLIAVVNACSNIKEIHDEMRMLQNVKMRMSNKK